jgi:hypothetical protein
MQYNVKPKTLPIPSSMASFNSEMLLGYLSMDLVLSNQAGTTPVAKETCPTCVGELLSQ